MIHFCDAIALGLEIDNINRFLRVIFFFLGLVFCGSIFCKRWTIPRDEWDFIIGIRMLTAITILGSLFYIAMATNVDWDKRFLSSAIVFGIVVLGDAIFCKGWTILRNKWDIVIGSGVLATIIILLRLFTKAFNGGEWWPTSDSQISTRMEDWGSFATCLAAIFALISVFIAFKAFSSQTRAAKRASFDAAFTQIFAQHSVLYQKVVQHSILYINHRDRDINSRIDLFTLCKQVFERIYSVGNERCDNSISLPVFWERYNKSIGSYPSVDFKNYFKYIYKEVAYIRDNSDGILDDAAQRQYIGLIEGQMNNDELFCYLVNQLDYYESHGNDRGELDEYFEYLKRYDFFKDICKRSSGYQYLVVRALGRERPDEISDNDPLVKSNWFRDVEIHQFYLYNNLIRLYC